MNEFLVYLYFVFNNIYTISQILLFSSIAFIGIYLICVAVGAETKYSEEMALKFFKDKVMLLNYIKKPFIILFFITLTIGVIFPDERQMKYIIGVHYLKELKEVKGIEHLPENTVNAVNKFLKQLSEENK